MNIIRAAFLLAFISPSVNASDEIEVYSLSTDNPTPLKGKGFELPNNIAEQLGFKYISYPEADPEQMYSTSSRSEENPPNAIGMHSMLHGWDMITTPTAPEWRRLAIAAAATYFKQGDKNYICAKYILGNATQDYLWRKESKENKGVDVLAILKKIILEDAFLTFKKAHLALNMHDLMALVKDVNREIGSIMVAGPVKAIRAINDFSNVIEGKPIGLGFGGRNILVLQAKDNEGVTHFLLIKLTPQAINEVADKAKEAANL